MAQLNLTKDHARYNYCFTWNNYEEKLEDQFQLWLQNNTKYAIYGHEIAPTTGTRHLQGYLSLKQKSRTATLQRKLNEWGCKLVLFYAKGSAQQNRTYCTKVDTENYFEHGNIETTGSGNRTDWIEIAEKMKKGTRLDAIAISYPVQYIQRHSGVKAFRSICQKVNTPEIRDLYVSVYYGTGGSGKTHLARQQCLDLGLGEPYWLMNPQNKSLWFDNYDGEKGLLIDDFYGWVQPHMLYRLLDVYKLQLPIKGATTYAEWTHVWITSNKHPREWYKVEVYANLDKDAYYRRLPNIKRFSGKYGDPDNPPIIDIEIEDKPLVIPQQSVLVPEESPAVEPLNMNITQDVFDLPSPPLEQDSPLKKRKKMPNSPFLWTQEDKDDFESQVENMKSISLVSSSEEEDSIDKICNGISRNDGWD